MALIATFLILADLTRAADLTFASGANCSGLALYGGRNYTSTPCYDLSHYDQASSIITGNLSTTQRLLVFSDNQCNQIVHNISQNTCTSFTSSIGSFELVNDEPKNNQHVAVHESNRRLVPYKDLAQTSPYNVDLAYSNLIIGAALATAGTGLTLYSAITQCTAITGPDPVPIFYCLLAPLATILSYVGAAYIAKGPQRVPVYGDLYLVNGQFTYIQTRELDGSTIDNFLMEYMSSMMNGTKKLGEHVAYVRRNMSRGDEQRSPVFEIESPDKQKWHVAAFLNRDSGTLVHHIRESSSSQINRRSPSYPYDDIRWGSGGLDFSFCSGNSGGTSGWSGSASGNYDVIYNQLQCLFSGSSSLSGATSVTADLYDENVNDVGNMNIVAFTGSSGSATSCPDQNAAPSLNQNCFVAS